MNTNSIFELLKYFDCFGTTFNFYSEKNRRYYTIVGGLLTLSSIVCGVLVFIYINLDDFSHNLPISTTSTKSENPRLIKFKDEKIWIPWRIRDYSGKTVDFKNLFYPIIYYYKGTWNNQHNSQNISYELINYKLCNETSMVNYSDYHIMDFKLDQLYCIDMEDLEIGGNWDYNFIKYVQLDIYSCKDGIDYDRDNENCTTYEDYIEASGENNSFEFEMYFPVVRYQPTNKTIPIFIEYSNYFYLFSKYSNKIDRIYLQKHILIDDGGWFLKDIHSKKLWGSSSLAGDSYSNGNRRDFMNEGSTSRFYSFNIYLESDVIYYNRSYKKIYLIIANGLPLFSIIYNFFKFIAKILKISSGNKRLTELLFENLKEKRTFFQKRIFPSDKSLQKSKKTLGNNDNNNKVNNNEVNNNTYNNNNKVINNEVNNNTNNNSNLLLLQNLNDCASFQDINQKNNLFDNSRMHSIPIEKKKPIVARNVKTQINTNINNNKNYINNLEEIQENDLERKSNSSSFNDINDLHKKFSNHNIEPRENHNRIINVKAKTHYIKKQLFPYKYYLFSIFIKNIKISKGTFFFTQKFIIVYNFICQLFDISSYLILQREFQTMKNTVIEEEQRHIIEKGQKINVAANTFSINMKECLDGKKLSIFGKLRQKKTSI